MQKQQGVLINIQLLAIHPQWLDLCFRQDMLNDQILSKAPCFSGLIMDLEVRIFCILISVLLLLCYMALFKPLSLSAPIS